MAKAAGMFARTFTKKGKTRHARQQMASNRKAQGQSLFGVDRKSTDLWNKKKRNMTHEESLGEFDALRAEGKGVGARRAQLQSELNKNTGLSRTERARMQNELKELQAAGKQIGDDRRSVRDVMDGKGSRQVDLSTTEQFMNKGKAAAHYMWGGSGKQIAARNGAAIGGIVGVNVGMDALDENI